MDRQEQLAAGGASPRHSLRQGDELIIIAREPDAVGTTRLELARHFARRRQRHVVLIGAGTADCARIDAAMAGIEHHQSRLQRRLGPLLSEDLRRNAHGRSSGGASQEAQQRAPIDVAVSHHSLRSPAFPPTRRRVNHYRPALYPLVHKLTISISLTTTTPL